VLARSPEPHRTSTPAPLTSPTAVCTGQGFSLGLRKQPWALNSSLEFHFSRDFAGLKKKSGAISWKPAKQIGFQFIGFLNPPILTELGKKIYCKTIKDR